VSNVLRSHLYYLNALARLTGTTLKVESITWYLDLEFKVEIRIKEVKMNSAKPTVIEYLLPRKTQRKWCICIFGYRIKVSNNPHAESTWTRPTRDYVSRHKRSINVSGTRDAYHGSRYQIIYFSKRAKTEIENADFLKKENDH